MNGNKLQSDIKFYADYSKNVDGSPETWDESVERVMNMHRKKFASQIANNQELAHLIDFAERFYKDKKVLGSQRALQWGGDPMLKHEAKMFNCVKRDTRFITSAGVKSFEDFEHGDECTVLTKSGKWKNAVVKSYGEQQLNKLTFLKGGQAEKVVYATDNHRWILRNGKETTSISEGDIIATVPDIFQEFDFDSADPVEQMYWCYGLVYGDGTVRNGHSMIRLCGSDAQFESRFTGLGWKSSSPASIKGDVICYTGKYQKTAPDPEIDSPELIKAFVAGYLQADGYKNKNVSGKQYIGIQSSQEDHIEFIKKCFPIAGVHILSSRDKTGQVTNYSKGRPYTVEFGTYEGERSKYDKPWKLKSIEPSTIEPVWCLEVEDEKNFVLEGGLVTGNCLSTYVDRIEFFEECMYWLLCGCGTGFSVQEHHISQLPPISTRTEGVINITIDDSIEGWSDAIGALVASFVPKEFETNFMECQGKQIIFDYSQIRPKGAPITGGFKAPGPEGLRDSIQKIEELLQNVVSKGFTQLRPIHAYDVIMHMADAVLSGGVRRAATICLFSPDDQEMLEAKIGNWFEKNPQRARSNNSVVLVRDETTKEQFDEIFKNVESFGEPGFVFVEDKGITVNPCVTGDTLVATSEGVKQVKELIDQPFTALVNGGEYSATGFWSTGVKSVFKLKTEHGHSLTLTDNHKILTDSGWKEAKDLTTSDFIQLHDQSGTVSVDNSSSDFEQGWLLGNLVGDGTFDGNSAILRYWNDETYLGDVLARGFLTKHFRKNKDFTAKETNGVLSIYSSGLAEMAKEFGVYRGSKVPNRALETQSADFIAGYIRGFFDADGSVQGAQSKGCSVRLTQTSLESLEQVQRMLLKFGINSTIYENRRPEGYQTLPDGTGGSKEYFCNAVHELVIAKVNLVKFSGKIGFFNFDKQDRLDTIIANYKRTPNKENFESRFKSLEYVGEKEVFDVTVEEVHCFDANGIVAHNCVEIGMWPQTEDGRSGWQGCNLVEINGAMADNPTKFYEACRAASILGTLQAGYTDFVYVDSTSKEIFDREALLGVSVTGWCNNPEVLFDTDIQREGAEIVKITNKRVAEMLGINQSARTTCVKPSGNASVLLGTASGIHGEHAPRYFRNMQMNKENDISKIFAEHNPVAVEESVWNKMGTDYIFSIPVEAPKGSLFKRHLLGVNQLELVRNVQNNWVEYGTNEDRCVNPIVRHNVSNTIQVRDWGEVRDYIFKHRGDFAGISLIGVSGDKIYAQAPFTEVFDREFLVSEYGDASLFASGLIVDALHAFNDDLWKACDIALGVRSDFGGSAETLQKDWVRRAKKFANNYFDGDIGNMTHCLKDVYNYHKWLKVKDGLVDIDWASELAKSDMSISVDTLAAAACVGGVCEL